MRKIVLTIVLIVFALFFCFCQSKRNQTVDLKKQTQEILLLLSKEKYWDVKRKLNSNSFNHKYDIAYIKEQAEKYFELNNKYGLPKIDNPELSETRFNDFDNHNENITYGVTYRYNDNNLSKVCFGIEVINNEIIYTEFSVFVVTEEEEKGLLNSIINLNSLDSLEEL